MLKFPENVTKLMAKYWEDNKNSWNLHKERPRCSRCTQLAQFKSGCCRFHAYCEKCYIILNNSKAKISCTKPAKNIEHSRKFLMKVFYENNWKDKIVDVKFRNHAKSFINFKQKLAIRKPCSIQISKMNEKHSEEEMATDCSF